MQTMNAVTLSPGSRSSLMWGEHMDYEVYEPDLDDPDYDRIIRAAYADMFNRGYSYEDLYCCD